MTLFVDATPQSVFPMKNRIEEDMRPTRRPKISVNLPLRGCTTACAIRYAEPSHEIIATEPKFEVMVAESVDVIVLSMNVSTHARQSVDVNLPSAARKEASHVKPTATISCVRLMSNCEKIGFLAARTSSSTLLWVRRSGVLSVARSSSVGMT